MNNQMVLERTFVTDLPVVPPARRGRAVLVLTLALAVIAGGGRWAYDRFTTVRASQAFLRIDSMQIGSPLEGQVIEVRVRPGQNVQAGEILVRLEDSRQRARVADARAAVDRAELEILTERENLTVDRQRVGVMSSRLAVNRALGETEARAADLEATYAKRQAERAKTLAAQMMGPRAEEEDAAALAAVADERLERARGRAKAATVETRSEAVERAAIAARVKRLALLEAGLATPKAALAAAEAELQLTVLRAPNPGRVLRRLVEPGSAVRVGAPLVELQIGESLRVEAWFEESELEHMIPDFPVKLRFEALPGKVLRGRIQSFSVLTDPDPRGSTAQATVNKLQGNRWVAAQIELSERDSRLIPGLSAEVELPR